MPDSNRITRCLCAAPFPFGNPCFTVALILCFFGLRNKIKKAQAVVGLEPTS
nr:MAG TPA: hypothetical protein [Caudoviricetes sp.]